jgi:hypothetical protein
MWLRANLKVYRFLLPNLPYTKRWHSLKKNMKISIYIITIILFFSFSLNAQENNENRIKSFNNFLGKEKSEAMNDAIQSFDRFLELNYKKEKFKKNSVVFERIITASQIQFYKDFFNI